MTPRLVKKIPLAHKRFTLNSSNAQHTKKQNKTKKNLTKIINKQTNKQKIIK